MGKRKLLKKIKKSSVGIKLRRAQRKSALKTVRYRTRLSKKCETRCAYQLALGEIGKVPFPGPTKPQFKFIDLFAGIGGFRLAFQRVGGECVFSSDWDKYSRITYEANFGEEPAGDIYQVKSADIPDHDVLCAGFPCQPFSIAGISKKLSLGRKHGFEDERQGNLFFQIVRILKDKKPKAFLLENVKNLKSHDGGKTFEIIYRTLTEELGYEVKYKIIDAKGVVPQHRERIFIAGFREHWTDFKFPEFPKEGPKLESILEKQVPEKYTLTNHLWKYLQDYARKHAAQGNGFGFGLVKGDNVARTLSARYYKDGSEILVWQGPVKNPRRLTPRECAALMGFPPGFLIPVSDTQAYRQFGNSVVVKVIEQIAGRIIETIPKKIMAMEKHLCPDGQSVSQFRGTNEKIV